MGVSLPKASTSALIKFSASNEIIFRIREDLDPHLSRSGIGVSKVPRKSDAAKTTF
jgi:hypothetical protein